MGRGDQPMSEEELVWRKRFAENLYSLIPPDMKLLVFAKRCDISLSSLNAYLRGIRIPNAYTVVKIARALGRPVTDIIDFFY